MTTVMTMMMCDDGAYVNNGGDGDKDNDSDDDDEVQRSVLR